LEKNNYYLLCFFGVNEDGENWSWEKKGSNLDDWEKLNNGEDVFVERTDRRREMKRRHRKNNKVVMDKEMPRFNLGKWKKQQSKFNGVAEQWGRVNELKEWKGYTKRTEMGGMRENRENRKSIFQR